MLLFGFALGAAWSITARCSAARSTLGLRLYASTLPRRCALGWANAFDHGTEVIRQWQTLKLGVGVLANILQIVALILGTKCDCDTILARASGTTDAVDILLGNVGQFVIDHVANTRDIDPAGRNISCDQNGRFSPFELVQSALPLRLLFVAVNSVGWNA